MAQLVKKIKITTELELLTGLHIGGSSENVEIGGIDNPVIKTAVKDGQPYIPGSSLKGKMRCLLEQIAGTSKVGGGILNLETKKKIEKKETTIKEVRGEKQYPINNLFGFSDDNMPSKIIIRDAYLTENSIKLLHGNDNLDMPYTEGKWENVIDRVKGTAENPRQTERVPAGVAFNVEFVINVWNEDKEEDLLALLKKGMKALENDYLGGNGSRGYGQIAFSSPLKGQDFEENNNWRGGNEYDIELD